MQDANREGINSPFQLQRKVTIDKSLNTSLPACARIKRKSEYDRVKLEGKRLNSRHFLLLLARAASSECRIGTIITRQIDKRAVVRNRIRRHLKELFRLNRHRFTKPVDIVFIARRDAQLCSFEELEHEILPLLVRQKFIR